MRFERYDKKAWDFGEIYPILRDFFGEREIVKIRANGKGKPNNVTPPLDPRGLKKGGVSFNEFVPVERFNMMSMTVRDETLMITRQ